MPRLIIILSFAGQSREPCREHWGQGERNALQEAQGFSLSLQQQHNSCPDQQCAEQSSYCSCDHAQHKPTASPTRLGQPRARAERGHVTADGVVGRRACSGVCTHCQPADCRGKLDCIMQVSGRGSWNESACLGPLQCYCHVLLLLVWISTGRKL